MTKMKGGELIAEYLIQEKVPYIFGICGHGNVGILDALYDVKDKLTLISPRHEQCAGHMADATHLLDELAQIDGGAWVDGTLAVAALQALPSARARNLLRYFLSSHQLAMPDARRLDEALRQITTARVDAQVCVALGDKALRRFAGALYVTPTRMVAPKDFSRPWHEQRRLLVPELQAALDMLMQGRTTIVIAHRLSTIEKAGRIVVLDGGRIAETGDHAALLAQGGIYARLYNIQFKLQEKDKA